MKYLDPWLASVLHFTDAPASPDFLHELWNLFGVDDELQATLVKYRLCWVGSKLEICSSFREDPHAVEEVAAALIAAWRFVKFTESRWGRLGSST